ncbi:hypothetical protein H1235_03760 [Pseudoxanthomonas sp. NC8]|nr:hypothetical protein H1235_03760 [Pseudoxanthomonas sp. NC8]
MVTAALVVLASKYLLDQAVIDTDSVLAAAEAARGNKPASAGEAAALKAYVAVTAWMSQHFAASTLLLLPFEAVAFRMAFHRFGNLNYPEWLVITAFLTVQTFVVWTVVMVLQRWIPQPELWLLGLSTLYGIFSLVQFLGTAAMEICPSRNSRLRHPFRRQRHSHSVGGHGRGGSVDARLISPPGSGPETKRPPIGGRSALTLGAESYFSALNRSRCGPASSPRRRFLSSSYSR